MKTLEARAAEIGSETGFDPAIIAAIITAILQALSGLGGICPKPTPPAKAKDVLDNNPILATWFARRATRQYLDDPQAYRSFGQPIAQAALAKAKAMTTDEFAAMCAEAQA